LSVASGAAQLAPPPFGTVGALVIGVASGVVGIFAAGYIAEEEAKAAEKKKEE